MSNSRDAAIFATKHAPQCTLTSTFMFLFFFSSVVGANRLGDEWSDICSEPPLTQTTELSIGTNNLHNIPPLLANAVIKKPQESTSTEPASSSSSSSAAESSEPSAEPHATASPAQDAQADASDACDTSDVPDKPAATIPNFLPDKKFYYNGENCYVFPGKRLSHFLLCLDCV